MIAALIPLLVAAAQAPQYADPLEPEERRIAGEAIGVLLQEDDNLSITRSYDGSEIVSISTRPRAAQVDSFCVFDNLRIRRAGPTVEMAEGIGLAPGSARIRSVESDQWFYVLVDERERPVPDVRGRELEGRCADVHPAQHRWFRADDAQIARSVVAGLTSLAEELRSGRSRRIEWRCAPSRCPSAERLAERIDPLNPMMATRGFGSCPEGRWCVHTLLDNPGGCGAWSTDLEMEGNAPTRLVRARIGNFVGSHCGHVE
jgi:hypothetical protein